MKNRIKKLLHYLGIYGITRKIFTIVYYPYKNYRIRSKAAVILGKMYKIFEEHTEDYWLDYGTLLGYIREGKIIKGDLDMDFGVITSYQKSLEQYMVDEGFVISQQIIVEGKVTAEQYIYDGVGFDIFYYRYIDDDKIATNVWLTEDRTVPQKVSYQQGGGELGETVFKFQGTEDIEFYGMPFKVPKNSASYLEQHYGKNYMIPNPNFSHKDEKNRKRVEKDYKVIFYE